MTRVPPTTSAVLSLVLLAGPAAADPATPPAPAPRSETAARIHRESIVLDTHLDVPYALHAKPADLGQRGATPHVDVPRMIEGGLGAGFFALYVPSTYATTGGAARLVLELSDIVDRQVAASEQMVPAVDVAGIRAARAAGRIAVLKGIEGGHAIENSLAVLRSFQALGVRYMTLTHTNTNDWADASGPFWEPDFDPAQHTRHGGLSPFGVQVVREMNRIGMAVDVSHVSDATIEDVLASSRAPVFASHSSARALGPVPRNLTDDQIKAIGSRGGVVMVNFSSLFVDPQALQAYRDFQQRVKADYVATKARYASDPVKAKTESDKLLEPFKGKRSTLARVADHLVHVHRLSPGAAGLGSDYDGIEDTPKGLDDISMLPRLTEELLARGLTEDEVKGILGENFLRFMSRVEQTAHELRHEPPATASRE